MPRFAVIGNLVKDVIAGAPARPGGAVFYRARVFSEIEYAIDARLVTRCESDDRELLLGPLEQFGLVMSRGPLDVSRELSRERSPRRIKRLFKPFRP